MLFRAGLSHSRMLCAVAGELLPPVPPGFVIDGAWRAAADGNQFSVHDPATGDVVARLAKATPSDAMDALDAADRAFPSWSRTPPRERAELLRRTFDLVMRDRARIARIITLEMGKPLRESHAEATYAAEKIGRASCRDRVCQSA